MASFRGNGARRVAARSCRRCWPPRVTGRKRRTAASEIVDGGAKGAPLPPPAAKPPGPSPFTDYTDERPGKRVKITAADLPAPQATRSVDNAPRVVKRPKDAWPQAPAGFKVELYADGLAKPRLIRTAPNGDVFVVESKAGRGAGVSRPAGRPARPRWSGVFANGLQQAVRHRVLPAGPDPRWIYVANTDSVVRLPYRSGDSEARGAGRDRRRRAAGRRPAARRRPLDARHRVLAGRQAACSSRSVRTRTSTIRTRRRPRSDRADILEFTPDGSGERVYASGIRNAVGIAMQPAHGRAVGVGQRARRARRQPRARLHHARRGGRLLRLALVLHRRQPGSAPQGQAPGAEGQGRSSPTCCCSRTTPRCRWLFYDGKQFPAEYKGDIFAAEHGSWNKAARPATRSSACRCAERHAPPASTRTS